MKLDRLPTPTDLMDHPQLAAIVALDTTLLVAMRALLAVHTDLLDDVFPRTFTEPDYWADRLVCLGCELEKIIGKYRMALLERNFSDGPDF